ncbi:MAG: histidine kinase, partial [Anaerolineae bacterium]|nr:histidine kinase [Anaerolineae bacterium]
MTKSGRPTGQEWAVLGLRLAASGVTLALAWLATPLVPSLNDPYFLPGALMVVGAALVLSVCYFIPALSDHLTWVILITGGLNVAGLVFALPRTQTDLLQNAAYALTALAALDILTSRWPWSLLAPLLGAGAGALAISIMLPSLPLGVFTQPMVALGGVSAAVWLWAGAHAQWGNDLPTRLRRDLEERERNLADSREMMRAVVEVSTDLSSQSTAQVLNKAMDVGQLALRQRSSGGGIVSIIFLYSARDESLQVFEHRGLTHLDTDRILHGKGGIVGQALSEATPIIGKGATADAELSSFVSLARTRSTLAVPLRMEYVNYGVMVFASADEDAFTEDRMDVMTALGTQVTVALQNATLYNRLRQEKERLVQLETNARQALVRDMHDIPTQTISAVTMRAGVAKLMVERGHALEKVVEELSAIEAMAQQATAEIRHVLFKLRPLALESQGISTALEQLAEKTRKTYDQNVILKCDDAVDDLLSQDSQDALFFIIEEAVSNARKYAKAPIIQIEVAPRGREVLARVRDNGAGFDVEGTRAKYNERGSFGMINLEERAELVGGRLTIQSQMGKGTAVT